MTQLPTKTADDAVAFVKEMRRQLDTVSATPSFLRALSDELEKLRVEMARLGYTYAEDARRAELRTAKYTPSMIAALKVCLEKGRVYSGNTGLTQYGRSTADTHAPSAALRGLAQRWLLHEHGYGYDHHFKVATGMEDIARELVAKHTKESK